MDTLLAIIQDPVGVTEAAWALLLATGVIGTVTTGVVQLAKKAVAAMAGWSDQLKRISTVVVAEVLALVQNFTGVALPDNLEGIDVAVVEGLAAALFSMGLYQVLKWAGLVKSA
jgi:hypothetical protein